MNKPKHFLALLYMAALLGFISCKRGRNISKTEIPAAEIDNTKALREKLAATPLNFNWLRIRSAVDFQGDDANYSANASFRMKKDELIWASVTMIIEAARLQITNDSAVLLNRLQKEYTSIQTADLQKMLAIEGLDVKALQKILLGRLPFGLREDTKLQKAENAYMLSFQNASYKEEMEIDSKNLQLNKYHFERNTNQYITVDYSDYKEVQGKILPHKIVLTAASPEKILLTLNVSEYTFLDTDDAPFSIPASYKKAK